MESTENSEQGTIFNQTLNNAIADQIYDSEFLNQVSKLSEIKYLEKLEYKIEHSTLKRSAKDSFLNIASGFTCKDTLLSYIEDGEYAILTLEQNLNRVAVSARKSDTSKVEYLEICSAIRDWFELFIAPRARGKERERIIAAKTTIETRNIVQTPEEMRERRGMGILDRIRYKR